MIETFVLIEKVDLEFEEVEIFGYELKPCKTMNKTQKTIRDFLNQYNKDDLSMSYKNGLCAGAVVENIFEKITLTFVYKKCPF